MSAPAGQGQRAGRRAGVRRGLLLGSALLAALVVLALLSRPGTSGRLDPGSVEPQGARALAVLLEQRGVEVERVGLPQRAAQAGPATTVLVPFPERLTPAELDDVVDGRALVVLVGAGAEQLEALGGGLQADPPLPVEPRRPECPFPQAQTAGVVVIGGTTYSAPGETATGCYAGRGRAPLLVLPDRGLALLGTGAPLTNDGLDEEGAAALALGLLGSGERVMWLLPDPGRTVDDSAQRPLSELVPSWVLAGALQLAVAALVLALWRARQLGPPVVEPLPVVVRSAEAVEGRARLYRASGARDRAAEALRAAARTRLARRLGLPAPDRPALVSALSERVGGEPADVDEVLWGPPPADDAGLVRLADEIDALAGALQGPPSPSGGDSGA